MARNVRQLARRTRERGAVLPIMAVIVVVLMGAAAMAVDLGWLYWQSVEIQHGADAAALAGVIYEPGQRTEAHTEAVAAALANGYDDGASGTSVSVIDYVDDDTQVDHENQLRVTITHNVRTLFLKVFGLDDLDISRSAVAQYTLPLALGSPEQYLGSDPSRGLEPGFWINVHGTWAQLRHGDLFGDGCLGTNTGVGCPQNPYHRPAVNPGQADASGGYIYAIDVPDGASDLHLEIFDGPWYDCPQANCAKFLTGDSQSSGVTWIVLYGPDSTPLDTTDGNELLCALSYDPRSGRSDDVAGWNDSWDEWTDVSPQSLIADLWDDMATSPDKEPGCAANFDRGPGIYPLRVMVEHDDSQNSYNHFSLRATTTGPQPRVYGLGDMAVYANVPAGGSTTDIYLAEVESIYAGKDLIIELYDVGDINGGSGGDELQFYDGFASLVDCSWESSGGESGSMGPCLISAPNKRFDDQMLTITVPIPDDYTCSGIDCWYTMRYVYTASIITDTTTWVVHVDGSPIRLVE